MKKYLSIFLFITTIFYISFGLEGSTKGFPKKAPPIKNLVDENNKPFNLEDYKGKILLVSYGYTQCPVVCPTLISYIKQVDSALTEKGYKGKYAIIFIAVDPKDDTPQRLKQYKEDRKLDSFIFLTGKEKDLKKIWKDYNVYVKDKGVEHGVRLVDHSAKVTIIDKKGYIREEFISMYLPVDKIVKDVIYLINEN